MPLRSLPGFALELADLVGRRHPTLLMTDSAAAGADLDPQTLELVADFLEEARDVVAQAEPALVQLETAMGDPESVKESVDAVFCMFHTMKGSAGVLDFDAIGLITHAAESLLAKLRDSHVLPMAVHIDALCAALDCINELLSIVEQSHGDDGLPGLVTRTHGILREASAHLDGYVLGLLAQGSIEHPCPVNPTEQPRVQTTERSQSRNAVSATIRVGLPKIDHLLEQVGELITAAESIAQSSELKHTGSGQLRHSVGQLSRIAGGLHDCAMSMRMVPVQAVFRKLPRVVRDAARKLGKSVELEITGEDTEIDKTVVEAIEDPLMHLVRNAVDHGIEDPQTRSSRGKEASGTLSLSSYHEGGEVIIKVSDDGSGIDPKRVVAHAIKRGLISPEQGKIGATEAHELLFLPGFSTSAEVTDISGRGVGMDVVRRNIEAVRGRIQISSELGEGTVFTIRVPLNSVVIDAMLLRTGESLYAVSLLAIRESVRVGQARTFHLPDGSEFIQLRDRTYPLIRLRNFHGLPGRCPPLQDGIVVIVENGERAACLFVDEIPGRRQIVAKALDASLIRIRGVSGCSITGTGELCLILDVNDLLSQRPRLKGSKELRAPCTP